MQISVRIPVELHADIQTAAKLDGRSMNSWIAQVLSLEVAKQLKKQ